MDNKLNNIAPTPAGIKSIITADDEADRYLNLQLEIAKKSKLPSLSIIALTMGFIFALAILFWIIPDKSYSEEENRALSTAPELTLDNFVGGKFTKDFASYMADQFPGREFFVGLKAACELSFLKGENNDVITADDGYLVARNDYPDESSLEKNLLAIGAFTNAAAENNISCTVAFAGRKQDVCDSILPSFYGSYYSDKIWGRLDDISRENGISYINLRDPLRDAFTSEQLYYKTDHHWTSRGAYLAYQKIAPSLRITPYSEGDFDIQTVSDSFYGTTWSSAGVKWAQPDKIDYYRFSGDTDYTLEVLDNSGTLSGYNGCTVKEEGDSKYSVFDGFYVTDLLNKKDKYASFIGGNFGFTKITKNTSEPRETLLVLKDSFSHSMVPFLARHYDLVMIDLRYYNNSIYKYCTKNNISNVLFLYNMETLCESPSLNILRGGLPK